ncbi:hypothetical protein HZB69_00585 [Candidatus Amesbacteria bacterium]|nr:hypothetical protein [Candidatus Amesbacteria bacterium]
MVNSAINDILLKFQLMQAEIREMQSDISKLKITMDRFYNLIDGIMGDFKKFGEEQEILSYRVSDHTDKLERLEEKVFGVASA